MKLSALLDSKLVIHPLVAVDKWTAIRSLAEAAVSGGVLPEHRFEEVLGALNARERSMTTGMEHGVAIPHAAVDGIDDVITVLGIAPGGVPFESIDGAPATIIVCLVIPRAKKLLHIRTLAEVAKLLARAEVRAELLAASGADAVLDVLRSKERESA